MIMIVYALISIATITGCNNSNINDDVLPVTKTMIVGKLTDQSGDVVDGADVVAVNRTTKVTFRTISNSNGEYSLYVTPGTYEVGAKKEDLFVTSIYGPLKVVDKIKNKKDFNMIYKSSYDNDIIFGKILHNKNISLDGWSVKFTSTAYSKSARTEALNTEVALTENGTFSAIIGKDFLLDIDIINPDGELEEFVVVHKTKIATYVELTIGDTTVDKVKYRHNRGPSSNSLEFGNKTSNRNREFTKAKTSTDGYNNETITLYDGLMALSGGWCLVPDSIKWDSKYTFDEVEVTDSGYYIKLTDDGTWWYDYKIKLEAKNEGLSYSYNFLFTDQSSDTYSLGITGQGEHEVSYNSDKPNVNKISSVFKN
jgi:hypothetical protein